MAFTANIKEKLLWEQLVFPLVHNAYFRKPSFPLVHDLQHNDTSTSCIKIRHFFSLQNNDVCDNQVKSGEVIDVQVMLLAIKIALSYGK